MGTEQWLPYAWGALGGLGVLLGYYGLRRVADRARPETERKAGLWLINAGALCLAASMALAIWVK
ncbi:MAG: hypothetical protein KIT16_18760 [Rhodospirillaceae bacterium]|nr:hypothetical protein [Rhodospirillaceae bacterium]